MRCIKDFFVGAGAHAKGLGFALRRKGYLPLVFIPFALTVALYVVGFSVFASNADALLAAVWTPGPEGASGVMAAAYWLYANVLKYLLYLLALALLYFLFMVVANIIASPLYDYIAGRVSMTPPYDQGRAGQGELHIFRVVLEEMKKAAFVLAIPLALLFVPVVGGVLALVFAMLLLAWDFVDFSLSRDMPVFRDRLRFVLRNKCLMLGFGAVLVIPLVSFALYPFAILGASILYQERHMALRDQTSPRDVSHD